MAFYTGCVEYGNRKGGIEFSMRFFGQELLNFVTFGQEMLFNGRNRRLIDEV